MISLQVIWCAAMGSAESRGFPYAELSNVDIITSVVQEGYRLPIPSDHCPDTM